MAEDEPNATLGAHATDTKEEQTITNKKLQENGKKKVDSKTFLPSDKSCDKNLNKSTELDGKVRADDCGNASDGEKCDVDRHGASDEEAIMKDEVSDNNPEVEASEKSKEAKREEVKEGDVSSDDDASTEEKESNENEDADSMDGKESKTYQVEELNDNKNIPKKEGHPSLTTKHRKKRNSGGKTMGLYTADLMLTTMEKRTRKSISRHTSSEFEEPPSRKEFCIEVGRGVKLDSIDSVRSSIKAIKKDSTILMEAHKLVFSLRGRPKQNQIKSNLLSFSGYLSPLKEGADQKKVDMLDEEDETKMSKKAFKLTVVQLKNLCDFFDVHREGQDKESLVDSLLDFLGAPDAKLTRAYKKKEKEKMSKKSQSPPSSVKRKRKVEDNDEEHTKSKKKTQSSSSHKQKVSTIDKDEEEEETEDDESDDDSMASGNNESKIKMPSDSMLRKWVKAYVACFNLDKATTKHAIETASDKFRIDLSQKKARIKEMLAEELS